MAGKLEKLQFLIGIIDKVSAPVEKIQAKLEGLQSKLKSSFAGQPWNVTVALVDKITAPLSKALASNAKNIQRFQSGFGTFKEGAEGIAAPVTDFMHGVLDESQKYQTIAEKFNQYGMGDAALKEAEKFTSAAQIMGASRTDMMTYFAEAQGVFRESGEKTLDHQLAAAKMAAPMLAKINVASKGLDPHMQGLMHDQQMDMLRFTEQMGGLKSPERFNELMSGGFKAIQSSGGNVDWSQYRQFVSKAGSSAYQLSDKALFAKLEPLIGEMKGGAAGDALMTSFQRLNGIVKNKAMAHKLIDYGVWDEKAVVFDALGGVKKFVPGKKPLKKEYSDMLSTDPVEFYEKVMLPKYKQRGLSENDIMIENSLIFGRQGGKMFNLMHKQRDPIHRSVEAFDKARGIDGSYNAIQKNYAGQKMALDAKWKDFQLALGKDGGLLDMATKGLNLLGDAVSWLTGAAKEHPALAKFALTAGAVVMGLAGFSMVASVVMLAVGALEMLGAVVGFILSPIGLIIAAVATLSYGAYQLWHHWAAVKAYLGETSWGQKLLTVIEWVTHPVDTFNKAIDYLSDVWASTKASLMETTWGQVLLGAITALLSPFESFKMAFATAKAVWDGVKISLSETSWGKAILDMIDRIVMRIDQFIARWDTLKTTASNAMDGVSNAASGAWDSITGAAGGAWDSTKNFFGVGSNPADPPAITQVKGGGDIGGAVAAFEKMGWTHAQAVGIVANLKQESELRAGAIGDGGKAYGVAQWHPDRQANFKKAMGINIRQASLDDQYRFVNYELTKGSEQGAGAKLRNATSAQDAAAIVSRFYERPAATEVEMQRRAGIASGIEKGLSGGGRATGGLIRSGIPYQVNERVPEVLTSGGKTWVMNDTLARIQPLEQYNAVNLDFSTPEYRGENVVDIRPTLAAGNIRQKIMTMQRQANSSNRTVNTGRTVHIGNLTLQINGEVDAERLLHELEMIA